MQYLLDTHTFLWFLNADERLPESVKNIVIDSKNDCFISIASLWEISIKVNLGKLSLDLPIIEIEHWLLENNIQILPISVSHIFKMHNYPFIIATRLTE